MPPTVDKDVYVTKLFKCLIHGSVDARRLPHVHTQWKAASSSRSRQLFRCLGKVSLWKGQGKSIQSLYSFVFFWRNIKTIPRIHLFQLVQVSAGDHCVTAMPVEEENKMEPCEERNNQNVLTVCFMQESMEMLPG